MKTRAFLTVLVAGCAAVLAQPAGAVVEVLGEGNAHACYMAAEAKQAPDVGIAICTNALNEQRISDRDRASTLVNRGVLEYAKGQTDAAMADFETGIGLMPDIGDAYVDRGVLLMSLSRYDEALADVKKGIDLGLSRPQLGYYNRAVTEDLMGRYLDAYHDYKHVLELEPSFVRASERLKRFTVVVTPAPR